MSLERFNTAQEFEAHAIDYLSRNEPANNLVLGILSGLIQGEREWESPFFGMLRPVAEIQLCLLMTPPLNLVLSNVNGSVDWKSLASELRDLPIPGVVGPSSAVPELCSELETVTGNKFTEAMSQKIYCLKAVQTPKRCEGRFAMGTPEFRDLASRWFIEFIADAAPHELEIFKQTQGAWIDEAIERQEIFFWLKEGKPVAMSALGGDTPRGIRVRAVYTPKELRGKGYASNLVAQVSQYALNRGKKYCFLYTDASNPTANSIYQKLGYEFVCDSTHWMKEKA